MSAPLDLDGVRGVLRQQWPQDTIDALLAEVERLRAESVPRSSLVQVGTNYGRPIYEIREATE